MTRLLSSFNSLAKSYILIFCPAAISYLNHHFATNPAPCSFRWPRSCTPGPLVLWTTNPYPRHRVSTAFSKLYAAASLFSSAPFALLLLASFRGLVGG